MMIYGRGGSGKSSYSVKLAAYLSKNLNKKILYIADEEKIGYLFNEKLTRFNAHNSNLHVANSVQESQNNFNDYDFVIFDSVTNIGLEPEQFEEYSKQNPKTSFIAILQATKEGAFRGSNVWEHLVDVKIRFENGKSFTEKSRFGGKGEVEVWT